MSGIYLHIPFCKKACHYCNFHFMTSLRLKDEMVNALCKELEMRKEYLEDKHLTSIYFGGGTPSILEKNDFEKIFETLSRYYTWDDQAELTIEANPDDLNKAKTMFLRQLGVNRLSIGIQSFFDTDLEWMNRAHRTEESIAAILNAQDVGINNLTIDLIYGSPYTTHEMWQQNVDMALDLGIQHISAYCLTVEEKTALHHMIQKGRFLPLNADHANQQFEYLVQTLTNHGFQHYEISNFAKPGYIAIHNTNYWKGEKYLGIGPSAHSYDGKTRSWNIANNKKYIDAILEGNLPMEIEFLTPSMRYNEYIMTGLRTQWGVQLEKISAISPEYVHFFKKQIQQPMADNFVVIENDHYILTNAGKYFADRIAMDLFVVED
ncbi:MAG: radical SAM family heme chaperone HemW [Chitinophagales bacterium]|nr:radical SAM family heme chaperone HemW [Chitinophagales bacterium]